MPRLIDADALKKKAFSDPDTTMSGEAMVYVQDVDNAPTIEAEPVRVGRWMNKEVDENKCHVYGNCSVCHEKKRIDNYCPNCGAKMNGGAEND